MIHETRKPPWEIVRLSATTTLSITQNLTILLLLIICEGAFFLHAIFYCMHFALGIAFLTATAFRLWCVFTVLFKRNCAEHVSSFTEPMSSEPWPFYTVVLALYKEAHMVPALMSAINALDYPRDRIEILVATEEEDHETAAACRAFAGSIPVVLVNGSGDAPKTKPRALNAALREARGDIIVVYDAEDQPHPLQLKEAAVRFMSKGETLGVVQAPLRIRVGKSSTTLEHHFSMDYAALFEVTLPALASVGWPFPLGGYSNHFRREALVRVGGWDPWNVTEDAYIGFQLAKLGYRSELLNHPTFESAPRALWPWVKQRSRWIKGHIQTLKVHTRRLADLTPAMGMSLMATLSFNLASAASTGPILGALTAYVLNALAHHRQPRFDPFDVFVLLTGWSCAILSMGVGVYRTGAKISVWHFLTAPLFWAAQCVAFGRAAHQLLSRPYHWDKTDHVPNDAALSGVGLDVNPEFGLSGAGDIPPPPDSTRPEPPLDKAVD